MSSAFCRIFCKTRQTVRDLREWREYTTPLPTAITFCTSACALAPCPACCTVPLAAHALFSGVDELLLQAAWGAADGSLLRAQCQAICTSIAEAEQIGMTVAQRLIQQGAVVAG